MQENFQSDASKRVKCEFEQRNQEVPHVSTTLVGALRGNDCASFGDIF
jgi:hypothetical protein